MNKMTVEKVINILALLTWLLTFIGISKGFFAPLICLLVVFLLRKTTRVTYSTFFLILIYFVSFLLFFINTKYASFLSNYFNFAISTLIISISFLFISKSKKENTGKRKLELEDILYFIILSVYVLKIFTYIKTKSFKVFESDGTYVAFGMNVLMCFLYGRKRGYFVLSFIFIILCFFLPSRTTMMYVILFYIFVIFNKPISIILKNRLFNRCIKIMIITFSFSCLFAYVIGIILPRYIDYYDGHGGLFSLYDLSNVLRSRAQLYGLFALFKTKSLVKGIFDQSYFNILNLGTEVIHHPHNSYLQLMVFYSVFFGVITLIFISKIMDNYMHGINVAIIIPYLIIACIYHDMFISHAFLLFVILNMRDYKVQIIPRFVKKYCLKINY